MPAMTETDIQQKLAEGWRWGGGEPNTNPEFLYRGSMDSVIEFMDTYSGETGRRFATKDHRDAYHKKQGLS